MRTRRGLAHLALGMTLVALGSRSAPARGEGSVWSDYRLGQFISSRGQTPADILALDNNGDILLGCRDGCSRSSLAETGIDALESQLELMRAWSLLEEDGDELRAAIPVLDRAQSQLLGERAGELVVELAAAVAGDVGEIVRVLEANGLGASAYAVIFSHVLDGEVWSFFDELSVLGRRDLSRRGAPWGGEAWAYRTDRELEPRTSVLKRESATVKVTWSEPLGEAVDSLIRGRLGLWTLFTEYLETSRPPSAELRARLSSQGILGAAGELTVPVIHRAADDPLHGPCERMTVRVAETVLARLDRPALVADAGLAGESQALVVAYHEIMWRMMEALVGSGAIELPPAIADPARAASLGDLVVIVRSPASAAASSDRDDGA